MVEATGLQSALTGSPRLNCLGLTAASTRSSSGAPDFDAFCCFRSIGTVRSVGNHTGSHAHHCVLRRTQITVQAPCNRSQECPGSQPPLPQLTRCCSWLTESRLHELLNVPHAADSALFLLHFVRLPASGFARLQPSSAACTAGEWR